MVYSILKRGRYALPAAALTLAIGLGPALSAFASSQEISVDAQSFESLNNNTVLHKARIAQGDMSVSAEQVTTDQTIASGFNFENGRWVFRGDVKITLQSGQLTSDEAQITFAKKLLSKAIINGKPAKFQQLIAKSGRLAQGHAELIEYDVTKGTVHLSKNAYLTDGQNEIHGGSLQYNLLNQNIVAEASTGSGRVHIVITPPTAAKP